MVGDEIDIQRDEFCEQGTDERVQIGNILIVSNARETVQEGVKWKRRVNNIPEMVVEHIAPNIPKKMTYIKYNMGYWSNRKQNLIKKHQDGAVNAKDIGLPEEIL